ncbi:MAG: hypothetical protein WC526_01160 [Patescibacteria group bacterium]
MPIQKLMTFPDTTLQTRAVRIQFVDGSVRYCSLNDFNRYVNRPHKADFDDEIPGFKLKYEGLIRGTFYIEIFMGEASEPEIDWLRQRFDGLPEPIPVIDIQPKIAPIAASAAG